MAEPAIAQKAPYGVELAPGDYLVVRLRPVEETTFLRRLAQGN